MERIFILNEKYEDKNTQNIIFVRRRFLNMKQETNETIEDYIDRFEMFKKELEVLVNTSITDEDAVKTILSAL
jgi:predicted metal-binding transcription factor (methanogenesis marker protein 9)